MKPEGRKVFTARVPCDFSHVGLEDGLHEINKYIFEKDIKTTGLTYLRCGIECDLLRIIDLSRIYCICPSFKVGYGPDEWSLHKLDKDFQHIIYWSPGV